MGRMAEYAMDAMEQEDESGLFDCERQHYEDEQEILRADPAFFEWLESIDHETTKEYERGYHCI